MRFQQLATQMQFRLSEGGGECLYCIGVEDNGHPRGLSDEGLAASLAVLDALAAELCATTQVLQTPPGVEGRCAVVRVAHTPGLGVQFADLRVAVAGGVDAGKSTLVAALTQARTRLGGGGLGVGGGPRETSQRRQLQRPLGAGAQGAQHA